MLMTLYYLHTISIKVCERSINPQWNESFYFLVHDPKHQMLVVKVRRLFTFICIYFWIRLGWVFIISVPLIVVVQWLGSANGISGGHHEGAACRATAGPGPVVPSGWSPA